MAPGRSPLDRLFDAASGAPALGARGLIRVYRYTLSGFMGRTCRHWPSCSEYTEEAIRRHGLWAGGWMGAARICRCGPWGTSGIDLVPEARPAGSSPAMPWRYGRWRGVNAPALDHQSTPNE